VFFLIARCESVPWQSETRWFSTGYFVRGAFKVLTKRQKEKVENRVAKAR
jgi:hypothetical protein